MIRAVIDTNVFVSGLLNNRGAPAKLILRWLKGQVDLVISEQTLQEHKYVLTHLPEISQDKVMAFLDQLRASSQSVVITEKLYVCKDPDDDIFLETAIAGSADFSGNQESKALPR